MADQHARTIMDYLATEFATFDEKPFSPVDSLVLSEFCMIRMEGIAPVAAGWDDGDGPAVRDRAGAAESEGLFAHGSSESPARGGEGVGKLGRGVFARLRERLRRARPGRSASPLATEPATIHFRDALRAERYEGMFTGLVPEKVRGLLLALAASPRFRDMEVREYATVFDAAASTQFAALSFSWRDEFSYIGFRGTDASFTGWREDFDMAWMHPVPAQAHALRYVNEVSSRLPGRLFVGGHSKGGNLAVYAAARADASVHERIERVFSHDGPGFHPDALSAGERAGIEPFVDFTVPEESVVGMLLDGVSKPRVVKSTARGIGQHDPFSWVVAADGRDFEPAAGLSNESAFFKNAMDEWLARYSDEEIRAIVDALFEALRASGARDLSGILRNGPKISELVGAATTMEGPARDVLLSAAASFSEVAVKHAMEARRARKE